MHQKESGAKNRKTLTRQTQTSKPTPTMINIIRELPLFASAGGA
jgi:hypothetical protein